MPPAEPGAFPVSDARALSDGVAVRAGCGAADRPNRARLSVARITFPGADTPNHPCPQLIFVHNPHPNRAHNANGGSVPSLPNPIGTNNPSAGESRKTGSESAQLPSPPESFIDTALSGARGRINAADIDQIFVTNASGIGPEEHWRARGDGTPPGCARAV